MITWHTLKGSGLYLAFIQYSRAIFAPSGKEAEAIGEIDKQEQGEKQMKRESRARESCALR